ncbi:MAG: hypothetical protein FJ222_07040 [Lentisphaerae bacterium]|nr:hypothetical protein [Lentisphaerota bacterium]
MTSGFTTGLTSGLTTGTTASTGGGSGCGLGGSGCGLGGSGCGLGGSGCGLGGSGCGLGGVLSGFWVAASCDCSITTVNSIGISTGLRLIQPAQSESTTAKISTTPCPVNEVLIARL